jgi:hypothetical protein
LCNPAQQRFVTEFRKDEMDAASADYITLGIRSPADPDPAVALGLGSSVSSHDQM